MSLLDISVSSFDTVLLNPVTLILFSYLPKVPPKVGPAVSPIYTLLVALENMTDACRFGALVKSLEKCAVALESPEAGAKAKSGIEDSSMGDFSSNG